MRITTIALCVLGAGAMVASEAATALLSAPAPVLWSAAPAVDGLCDTDATCQALLVGHGCEDEAGGVYAVPLYAREEDQFPGDCVTIERQEL